MLVVVFFYGAPAAADPFGPRADPAAIALAGAVIAHAVGWAALDFNPAALAQGKQYTASLGYANASDPTSNAGTVAVVDSVTNPSLAAGFAYTFESLKKPGLTKTGRAHRIRAGLALAQRGEGGEFYLGATTHYDNEKVGDSLKPGRIDQAPINFDIGALLVFHNRFRLGLTAANILDKVKQGQPREIAGAAGVNFGRVQVEYDLRFDFDSRKDTRLIHAGSIQVLATRKFPLRVGFRHDGVHSTNLVSGGFGFATGQASIEVAYAQELDGENRRFIGITVRTFIHL